MNSDELGYYLHPAAHPGDPGYPRLDVNLFAAPTHRHYDTRVLHLPVAHFGSVRQMDIRHPWHVAHYRVCAGRITLRDFVDKPVVFFSFGGNAVVEVLADHTHCTITSDAPILHLIEEEDPATVLSEEFEALLARRRGAWAGRQDQYESRLAKVEPFTLYLACLNALHRTLDEGAHSADDGRAALRRILHDAIHAVEASGRRAELAPTLEQLL
ncbi:MAG: hypothetical protein RMN52_16020 [Anaerolineae bacterium]|nr:hypothetical protein [Candidatus Roseilinea sp.]MDW8451506.1 hypothetical protein [Anaerolineae bacterium]